MDISELSNSERQIIEEIRTLNPFERIEITADKDARPSTYLITRTRKAILIMGTMNYK